MSEQPRGRPKKYPEELISLLTRKKDLTKRGAQNKILEGSAAVIIGSDCSEETQRFFFGGRTFAEAKLGMPKLCTDRNFVMQELGRWPRK